MARPRLYDQRCIIHASVGANDVRLLDLIVKDGSMGNSRSAVIREMIEHYKWQLDVERIHEKMERV